jgi:hypothetical protein
VVRAKDIGSVYYQYTTVYQTGALTDTFTTAANGTTRTMTDIPVSRFSMQLKGTGAAASAWNVVVEVSLDGTTFTTILTHANTTHADGATITMLMVSPVLYFRARCVSVTLGGATNVVATVVAKE